MYNEGIRTFTANGALGAKVRVKLTAGSATTPPQVEVAGAGEQHIGITEYAVGNGEVVAVRLRTYPGTHEATASKSFAVGAVLYGAAAGKVKDSSDGTAIGIALEASGGDGEVVEMVDFTVISTTAASISIADAGSFTAQTTVEAALQELYQNAISVKGFIGVSLTDLREVSSMAVGNIAANGGLLASDTTPILQPINGATDGCQAVVWAAGNADPVMFQVSLPPDIDITANIVLHTRIKSAGTTNAVGFTVDTWWGEGDTKITDTSETNQTTSWADKITTIAAADLHDVRALTVSLTPVTHGTDALYLSDVYLEYKTKLKTS